MQALRAPTAFDGERFLDGGVTVLLDGARIRGVEPFVFEPPSGVELSVYDGTLLPGLIDGHVHLVSDSSSGGLERAGGLDDAALDVLIRQSLRQQAVSGVTTVRDLGDAAFRTVAARDRGEEGLPRIVAAGPPLTTPGGHCHYLGGATQGVDGVRGAVAEHADRGVDVIKVMASGGMLTQGTDVLGVQFSADELAAAVRAAHQRGLPLLAHAHSLASVRHALRAGVDGIEHFSCLTEAGVHTPDDVLAALAAADTVVGPTLGLDLARMPSEDQLPPQLRALLERLSLSPEKLRKARAEQLAKVRAHGIRVVTGVDAGASPPKHHGMVWMATLQLLEAGYPLAEALATATSQAADACGLGAETGRLRAGLAADLLVVDGDLRADPAALGRPTAVVVRGARVSL